MKLLLSVAALLVASQVVVANNYNVTCFYDTSSVTRGGSANLTLNDLQTSLQLCTHVVYGYVGIKAQTFEVVPLDKRQLPVFQQVRDLKKKYRNVKFLLSLGGDMDYNQPEKYMQLLQGGSKKQQTFIQSTLEFLRKYQFDGLDMAYQLPRNKPSKKRSKLSSTLRKVKKVATERVKSNMGLKSGKKSTSAVRRTNEVNKQQMTQLIADLRSAFKSNKLMLTLTVMPNVNASRFFNVPAIMRNVDFVNLAAFDFVTPTRNPKFADYLAPLYEPPKHAVRNVRANVDSQIQYWISQQANPKQLNLGVPAYGRTWKILKVLKTNTMPITSGLEGPANGDSSTHIPGLMGWSEICKQVKTMSKFEDKKYGNYAYRAMEIKGSNGILVTYESIDSITEKAAYVQNRGLGGMALFDLSLDDFRGQCTNGNDKFPLLKNMRYRLM